MALYIYYSLLLHLLPLAASTTFNPGTGNSFGRPNQNETYDYVVIGRGTARLAVAMRLVENTVAVVEAGGFYQIENGNQSVVPAYNPEFASLYHPITNPTID
jgi:choline dehydrogenase